MIVDTETGEIVEHDTPRKRYTSIQGRRLAPWENLDDRTLLFVFWGGVALLALVQ